MLTALQMAALIFMDALQASHLENSPPDAAINPPATNPNMPMSASPLNRSIMNRHMAMPTMTNRLAVDMSFELNNSPLWYNRL